VKRLNIGAPEFVYDAGDPDGFRAGMLRAGPLLDARQLGASVYELPPGQTICPYHYEYGEEEWLLVLVGRPVLRHPGGEDVLEPWDLVVVPTGPEGAHSVRNDSEETVRVLMFSTLVVPTATAYPDSGKIGVWTGHKDEDLMARRTSAVDYYDGEVGGGG
jgi:uncharacterized cupin superfamily protein